MSAVIRMRTLAYEPLRTGYSQCSANAARESANRHGSPLLISALNFLKCLSALLSLLKTSSLSNQMLNPRPWASEKDR